MLKVALFDFREPRYFMPGHKQRLITALKGVKRLPFPVIVKALELNRQHSRELLYAHSLHCINLKKQ